MSDVLIVTETSPVVVLVEPAPSAVIETEIGTTVVTTEDVTEIVMNTVVDLVIVEPETITNIDVLTVGEQGPAGPPGTGTEIYEQRAEITSDYEVYRGEAALGALDAQPVWRIRRIIIFYGVVIAATTTWANGSDSFVHDWTMRHTYTFS